MDSVVSHLAPTDPNPGKLEFQFTGSRREYFKIWAVNLLLSIVTLGFYSPWAKVKNRKYLYRHTLLDGHSFDYHADPKKILWGRLLLAGLFIVHSIASEVSLLLQWVPLALIALTVPWLIVRSHIFNLSNTSYRNIRLGFKKDYKEAYRTYLYIFAVLVFTLGLGFLYAIYKNRVFVINNTFIGQSNFQVKEPSFREFYFPLVKMGLVIVFSIITFMVVALLSLSIFLPVFLALFTLGTFLFYGLVLYYQATVKALCFTYFGSRLSIGSAKLNVDIKTSRLARVEWTYTLLQILTLGLYRPVAECRRITYKSKHTILLLTRPGELDELIAAEKQRGGHIGDAFTDFWDIDIAL